MARYRMWKWGDSWLNQEWVWYDERRDLCGSRIDKKNVDQLKWLENPVVLYLYEDIIFHSWEEHDIHVRQKPPRGERYYLDNHLQYKELKSIKGIRRRLKDKELVKALEKQGGTCITLPDSEHGMVILFWVGRTHGQVEDILDKERYRHENSEALEQLNGAMKTLLKNVGAKQTKQFVAETLQEVTA